MSDVQESSLEHFSNLPGFEEVYEVVKTAEVVFKGERHRIEVLKTFADTTTACKTRSYKGEIIDGKRVWVDNVHAPWTARDDADGALWQGLGFLAFDH
jgi:hypothetical protein